MSKRAWLTSDSLPAGDITLLFKLPNSDAWRAQLRGALLLLADAKNFEQFGNVSPDEQADTWRGYILEFFEEKQSMLPAGIIAPFAGGLTPDGWLLCDGSLLYITDYPDLFAAIQWVYGGYDDNENRFKLPDVRGRMIAGVDVGQAEFEAWGQKGGEKTHVLSIAEIPSHNHNFNYRNSTGVAGAPYYPGVLQGYTATTGYSFQAVSPVGGGGAHNNLPPYMALNFIIKT
jgi:microcystin-dependent protein